MCQNVITLKSGDIVPCNKCPDCRKRRISGWSFRLMQQDKISSTSYFITLTYDTDAVHITQSGFMGLVKRDMQLFFKKLRKAHEGWSDNLRPIKYYAVGEYGGKSYRPHYHVILFGAALELMVSKNDLLALKAFNFDGKHPVKCKQWDKGHITVGQVTGASVGYTMKYISKRKRIPMHRNDDRLPEFSLMSKGLGVNYLTDAIFEWHHADLENRMYLTLEDGRKVGMPRYYKEKLYDTVEKMKIARVSEKKMLEEYVKIIDEVYQWDIVKHRNSVRSSTAQAYRKMDADLDRNSKI